MQQCAVTLFQQDQRQSYRKRIEAMTRAYLPGAYTKFTDWRSFRHSFPDRGSSCMAI